MFPIVDSRMCSSTMPRKTIPNNALLLHHGGAFSIYIADSDTCILTVCSVEYNFPHFVEQYSREYIVAVHVLL